MRLKKKKQKLHSHNRAFWGEAKLQFSFDLCMRYTICPPYPPQTIDCFSSDTKYMPMNFLPRQKARYSILLFHRPRCDPWFCICIFRSAPFMARKLLVLDWWAGPFCNPCICFRLPFLACSFLAQSPNTTHRFPWTITRSSRCASMAFKSTFRSRTRPFFINCLTESRWDTIATSCSIMGPSSSTCVV